MTPQLQTFLMDQLDSEAFLRVLILIKLTSADTAAHTRIHDRLDLLLACVHDDDHDPSIVVLDLLTSVIPYVSVTRQPKSSTTPAWPHSSRAHHPRRRLPSLQAVVAAVLRLHLSRLADGDMLVFLAGADEIEACCTLLAHEAEQVRSRTYVVLALLFKLNVVQPFGRRPVLLSRLLVPFPLQLLDSTLQATPYARHDDQIGPRPLRFAAAIPRAVPPTRVPRKFFTVYIDKTLTTVHAHLTTSTLNLLADVFSSTTTDDFYMLQTTLAQQHAAAVVPLLPTSSPLLRHKAHRADPPAAVVVFKGLAKQPRVQLATVFINSL